MAYVKIFPNSGSGGGGGGIASINGDTTSAQIITGGTDISAVTTAGDTVISFTGSLGGLVVGQPITGGTPYGNVYEDGSGSVAVGFILPDPSGQSSIYINNRQLFASDGTTAMMDWSRNDRVNIGPGASAIGTDDVVIGAGVTTSSNGYATVVGGEAYAAGTGDVVLGQGASTQNGSGRSMALGNGASTGDAYDIAVGYVASTAAGTGGSAISIGSGTVTGDTADISIGTAASTASSTGGSAIAIGNATTTQNPNDTAIGGYATTNFFSTGQASTAIGYLASTGSSADLAAGYAASTSASAYGYSVALGRAATGDSYDIAIGHATTGSGGNAVAIGSSVSTGDQYDIAIGAGAMTPPSSGGNNISLGVSATSTNNANVSIGASASTNGSGVAIGYYTYAAVNGIAIGYESRANDMEDIAIGQASTSTSTGGNSISIGPTSATLTHGQYDVAIGYQANTNSSSGHATAINNATVSGTADIGIGYGAFINSSGGNNIAIGGNASITPSSFSSVYEAIAIGTNAQANNYYAVALGPYTGAIGNSSVAIGSGAGATADYTTTIGAFQTGYSNTTPNSVAIGGFNGTADQAWLTLNENSATFSSAVQLGLQSGVGSPAAGMIAWDSTDKATTCYNGSVWSPVGSLTPHNSFGSPVSLNSGTILTLGYPREVMFIVSNGGAVTITGTPPINAGTFVGQELVFYGTDNTNTVKLVASSSLLLNGDWVGRFNSSISLMWNGTYWWEISRNGI